MNKAYWREWIPFLIVIILVSFSSLLGRVSDNLYLGNSQELIIRSKLYDLSFFLFVIPLSIFTIFIFKRNLIKTKLLSYGISIFILFSYSISVFTINQNRLFFLYIYIISIAFFYFVKGYFGAIGSSKIELNRGVSRWLAITLLISSISGVGYWTADLINSFILQINSNAHLEVKAPQVFDLAFILPFTIYGAVILLKGRKQGLIISLIMIIFFALIGFSVVTMEVGLNILTHAPLDLGKVISYSVISILNTIVAIISYKNTKRSNIS